MASMEEQIKKASDAKDIPGVTLFASDVTGKFVYQNAIGLKNPTTAIDINTTFIMASCTKLMTSISAMQCVERGQITLNEDVSRVLPELKGLDIISGFEESGEPIYKKSTVPITLKHLLTHSSGIGYDNFQPQYHQWHKSRGELPSVKETPILKRISLPLLFEPGTSWAYGAGLDWTGLLVGRLNNTTLEEYMEKNIWTPLGIKNITFHQEKKPDVRDNLVKMSVRAGIPTPFNNIAVKNPGVKVEWTDEEIYENPTVNEFGGHGAIGSGAEYIKILVSILKDDGILLQSETIDEMFTAQLSESSRAAFKEYCELPYSIDMFSSLPLGTNVDYGLGGQLVMDDFEYGKKKGTLSWSGLPNLLWTIDREAGLACFYGSNICPWGDFQSAEIQRLFEKEMYKRLAEAREKENL